jgi:hypothetical protein
LNLPLFALEQEELVSVLTVYEMTWETSPFLDIEVEQAQKSPQAKK